MSDRTTSAVTEFGLLDRLAGDWDAASAMPKQRQLYEQLRQAILRDDLRPGTKLPSSRALAQALGLGRNTVLYAYEQLLAEGYVVPRHGAGTYVTDTLPDPRPAVGDGRGVAGDNGAALSGRAERILERIHAGHAQRGRTG